MTDAILDVEISGIPGEGEEAVRELELAPKRKRTKPQRRSSARGDSCHQVNSERTNGANLDVDENCFRKVIKCVFCPVEIVAESNQSFYQSLLSFYQHLFKHNYIYKCLRCDFLFASETQLKSHLVTVHGVANLDELSQIFSECLDRSVVLHARKVNADDNEILNEIFENVCNDVCDLSTSLVSLCPMSKMGREGYRMVRENLGDLECVRCGWRCFEDARMLRHQEDHEKFMESEHRQDHSTDAKDEGMTKVARKVVLQEDAEELWQQVGLKPFCCRILGCPARFVRKKELEDHLSIREAHRDDPVSVEFERKCLKDTRFIYSFDRESDELNENEWTLGGIRVACFSRSSTVENIYQFQNEHRMMRPFTIEVETGNLE